MPEILEDLNGEFAAVKIPEGEDPAAFLGRFAELCDSGLDEDTAARQAAKELNG